MTALTLYMTNSATTTLAASNKLVTVIGAGLTNKNTTIGRGLHYGVLASQGSNSWAGATTIPAANGNGGFLWENTTLADGSASFSSGTWAAIVRLNTNSGSLVADIYVRVYRRASNGSYNTIVVLLSSGRTITSNETNFTLTHPSTAASSAFQTGDMLYLDVLLNITSNTTNSTTTVGKINVANSSTIGNASAQISSPGYSTITNVQLDASTRFKLSSSKQNHDASLLFRLSSSANNVLKNAQIRMRLIGRTQKDAVFRLRTQASGAIRLNAPFRLRTKKSLQRDAAIRFRLSIYSHSALFPPAVRRTGRFTPAIRRQTV